MIQGTSSDAGKSLLVTALCRILARNGVKVAPFKSQNMSLNSAVTPDGSEIGRAQAVQAEACYLLPTVEMNPVLIKPNSDINAQIIVNGKAVGNMQASQYHNYKPELLEIVSEAHRKLQSNFQVVIAEGAGSPAEINLRDRDIVNMGFAEKIDCPVVIIADIDRGGVFAQLVGTYELLSETERQRVVGFVINRFRGDKELLKSGLEWLEKRYGIPVIGVLPYIMDLHIEAEDAVNQQQIVNGEANHLKVVVPFYPSASNNTDFDSLRLHPQVDCKFLRDSRQFSGADMIVLPGSKNVRHDLQWLNDSGWQEIILRHLRFGGRLIGICGGYQMLGKWIHDPMGVESTPGSSRGLGLLDIETTLTGKKVLRNVEGISVNKNILKDSCHLAGYEIHTGISKSHDLINPLFQLWPIDSPSERYYEGACNEEGTVIGTYLHSLFDQKDCLNKLLHWAGLSTSSHFDYPTYRKEQFDHLADIVEEHIDFEKICRLLNIRNSTE